MANSIPAPNYVGLIFPEDILQSTINSVIKSIQTDEVLIGELLQNKEQINQDRIHNAITQQAIRVLLGFPRSNASTPQVTITLANADEDTVLADEMNFDPTINPLITSKINTGISISQLIDKDHPLTLAITTTLGTIPVTGLVGIDNELFTFDTGLNNSVRLVHRAVLNTEEETHVSNANFKIYEISPIVGSYMRCSYRIDVLDDNADTAIFLSSLILAALRANARMLGTFGLSEIQLSATDFGQQPQFEPSILFMRTIIFSCKYQMTMPVTPIASVIGLNFENDSPEIDGEQGGGPGNAINYSIVEDEESL